MQRRYTHAAAAAAAAAGPAGGFIWAVNAVSYVAAVVTGHRVRADTPGFMDAAAAFTVCCWGARMCVCVRLRHMTRI